MRKSLAIAIMVTAVTVLSATSDARVQAPSGDTCTYAGSGTVYTVNIVTSSAAQQYGFAFGATGLTITNVAIPGQNGGYTNAKLAPNTTGAWISDTPLTGSFAATLTVTGTATGPAVVVPAAASQASYFDPVTCTSSAGGSTTGGATAKKLSFTVASAATYSAAAKGWHLVVTVPAAATVSAKQPLATSISVKPKPLVQAKRVVSKSRGKVTLLVKATPAGQAILNAKQALEVKLTVTVDSRDGREAHKTVSLTLRK